MYEMLVPFIIGVMFGAMGMYVVYVAGHRSRKPAHREVDQQQLERAKRLKQSFDDMMTYSEKKATARKGVG